MDVTFYLNALDRANTPKIFNTDQGSQSTSRSEQKGIAISQDGRSRALDNI